MKPLKRHWFLMSLFVALAWMSGPAMGEFAQGSKAELRQRSEARYPELAAAKAEGKLGETSEGLVEPVKDAAVDPALQKLVDEENRDRRELYQILAKETNTDPSLVARRAATRNFERARPGEWLKRDGTWEQKK
jgi:uncharacterized protein YdbL (DUF1318 family)